MNKKPIIKILKKLAIVNLVFAGILLLMAGYTHFILHEQTVTASLWRQFIFSLGFFCLNYLVINAWEDKEE